MSEALPKRREVKTSHGGGVRLALALLALCVSVCAQGQRPHAQKPLAGTTDAGGAAHARATQAFAEGERLRAQWTADSLRRAVAKYEEALRFWGLTRDTSAEVNVLNVIGDVQFSVGDVAAALVNYEKALASSRLAADRRGEALSLNNVCYARVFIGEAKKALDLCNTALSISRELNDAGLEGQTLGSLGKVYYSLSEMGRALELFAEALPRLRAAGLQQKEAQALLNAGYTHANLSDATRALAAYEEALPLWRAAGDKRGEALTLGALGHLYNKLEEKQKALELYDRTLRLFRAMGDRYGEANTLNGMAFIYRRLGERAAALDYYTKALGLYRLVNHRTGQALALISCGRVYNDLGNYTSALDNFRQAFDISRGLGDPLVESYALGYLGRLYYTQGDRAKALEYYERALELNRVGKDAREEAYTLNNIGYVHAGLGDRTKALDYFQRSLALNEQVSDPGGASLNYYSIARAERDNGRLEEARAAISKALEVSEKLRTKLTGQDSRANFFATVHQQFELYLDVLMRLDRARPDEGFEALAFETAERSRARSLLEALAEARANIRQGVETDLLDRESDLQRRINAKTEQRIQLASGKTSGEALAASERELEALTTEYERVQGQIRASSPRYAALVQPVPLTLREIQQKVLDADTLLLEYALGEERSFMWAVTPDRVKGFELPARAEVERAAGRVYELLTAPNRTLKGETWQQKAARVARAESEYTEAADALGRMLLGPVAGELGEKRIVVVADGALQYVPFAALPEPSGVGGQGPGVGGRGSGNRAGVDDAAARAAQNEASSSKDNAPTSDRPTAHGPQPLILKHEVVSLPSASVLALMREELRGRRPAPKSVAVLADPVFDRADDRLASLKTVGLRRRDTAASARTGAISALRDFDGLGQGEGIGRLPFSRREAEAIMRSAPTGEGMLALGFRASRAVATSGELSQYRIVHFATHGLLNSKSPELSGVVLSLYDETGRDQDGFLQLHEIYNLSLPAELVVLSACQTALGKDVRGEGLIGLTRGFMYAGAPRVVASLWKVDDAATAELMGEFYHSMLTEGMRPAEALRAAQRRMLQQPRRQSPYYWAAFTLQGEWR